MCNIDSPMPLSDIESVLAWVDTFKLSRSNKKINRDFSDAVLLAEILNHHYPKLVEMHNYPPRNSQALKLNNWMTLNRKVLKKLKLNLCCNTMEQLANCAPGVIERVLVMVRDKIRRDEEANKSKDSEQNVSSGGSYYEACGDDDHVLVVSVKTRVNGVLETIQQKVINYESYTTLKEELKDAKDSTDLLKQKVDHLDNLIKLKDERIDELQKQLDRKQARRKETEALHNSLAVPFETVPSPVVHEIIPQNLQNVLPIPNITNAQSLPNVTNLQNITKRVSISNGTDFKKVDSKIPISTTDSLKSSKPSITEVSSTEIVDAIDKVKSDVFKEVESDERSGFGSIRIQSDEKFDDVEEFKDSEQEGIVTINDTIQREITAITNPVEI